MGWVGPAVMAGSTILSSILPGLMGKKDSVHYPQPNPYSPGQPISFLPTGPDSYVDAYTGITYRWSDKGGRWKPSGQMSPEQVAVYKQQAIDAGGPFSFTQPQDALLKQYYDTFTGPEMSNYYTSIGQGRSGAAGEALGKAAIGLSWQDLLRRQGLVAPGGQAPQMPPSGGQASGGDMGGGIGSSMGLLGMFLPSILKGLGIGGTPATPPPASPYTWNPNMGFTGPGVGFSNPGIPKLDTGIGENPYLSS